MKLKELKEAIDQAVAYAGDTDPDVEVVFKKTSYEIRELRQFSIMPDVMIYIGEKTFVDED